MLTMREIRKSFSGIEVLHGVDFSVAAGQVHALVGHNGAGKSTLMKALGGSYPDYTGQIEIDGRPHELRAPRQALDAGVAIIYQDFALVPDLDVAHNIALGREPGTAGGECGPLVPHRTLVARSAAEAARFGIDLPMTTPVRDLGVAAQQLTEIVRALARDVKVLVMDEPTARLAPAERRQLFRIIRSLADQGVAVVYISHFLDEVLEVADDVTILRDGSVVAHRPAAELTPDALAIELVGPEGAAVEQAVAARTRRVAAGEDPLLRVRGLRAGAAPVDLDLYRGQVVALAGLVGSGRTRIARALIGHIKAPGEVVLDGRPVPRNPRGAARRGLILVPEDRKRSGLVMTGTVTANVELTALGTDLARGGLVRARTVDQRVRDLIARFGIRPPQPRRLVSEMSGGNAQKVLVARAVAATPRVIVVDQPTAGVDVGAKADLHAQITALADQGAAVLVISDDLDETLDLADRVLVVTGGQITREIDPADLDRASLLAAISTKGAAA